jgi:Flp pilus assembly pilin Flp
MKLADTLLGLFVRSSVRIDTFIAGPARGQGLVEYALILALIAIVAIVALVFLGGKVSTVLRAVGTSV